MKRIFWLLSVIMMGMQGAFAFDVNQFMDDNLAPCMNGIASFIFTPVPTFGIEAMKNIHVPFVIFWILIAGIFFTIYFKGVSIWGLKHAVEQLFKPKNSEDSGDVSSFQALATALSGTIGIGSIAGVALSISVCGPGAAFWIFVGALLGMSIKFAEATLAIRYRKFNLDGSVSGGPMHYIAHGLTRKGMRWLGQPLSVIFAIICIAGGITGGNMIQINQTAEQIVQITGQTQSVFYGATWIIGLIAAIVIGLVVVGGIKSIAKVTTILTPSMCLLYILLGLIVILCNFTAIPQAVFTIVKEAFLPKAIFGGAMFFVMVEGLKRSVQSNEAGTGAAAIVYAAAQSKEPASQGFVALLETFLTGVLCVFTSLTIVLSGVLDKIPVGVGHDIKGISIASEAFASVHSSFPIVLSFIAVLFALSTLISWAYYGQKAWTFLFGEGKKRVLFFNLLYCAFVVIGTCLSVEAVKNITDAMMIAMSIPNIITLYILAPDIKRDMSEYCKKMFSAKQ